MSSRARSLPDLAALKLQLEEIGKEINVADLSSRKRRRLSDEARALVEQLGSLIASVDPIQGPTAFFDPSDPNVMGAVTALALVAQPRSALSDLREYYGSGVYAIYYGGDFDLYRPISGTETPIYVGQAAPAISGARNPFEQGTRLSRRLKDHQRSIKGAKETLNLADFEVRQLAVQSKLEGAAESYLISLFRPVWNKEVKLVYGIGKHGDDPETRANKRSPWDVIHDSRSWARTEFSRSRESIYEDVAAHYKKWPPLADIDAVLEHFLASLRQLS